jgi:hypothetical protein
MSLTLCRQMDMLDKEFINEFYIVRQEKQERTKKIFLSIPPQQ